MDKKAQNVVILDLRKLEAITDFFVICTGEVDQQVRAIAEHIEEQIGQKTGDHVLHREGLEHLNWVLLDFVDVVIHVFKPSFREFYRLEDLWSDADAWWVECEKDLAASARPVRRRTAVVKSAEAKADAKRPTPTGRHKKTAKGKTRGRKAGTDAHSTAGSGMKRKASGKSRS